MALQEYKALFRNGQRIGGIYQNGDLVWPAALRTGPDYTEPFYVENTGSTSKTATITKNNETAPTLTIEYSTDRTNWSTLGTTSTTVLEVPVAANSKVYLRCNTNTWCTETGNIYDGFEFNDVIGGNIMSLLYGSNFSGNETAFPDDSKFVFSRMFWNSSIRDISKLLLPALTLNYGCYHFMFRGCTSITKAPELLAPTCVNYCYAQMFRYCSSLKYVKCLATSRGAKYCTAYWMEGVGSGGTFVKKEGVSWPGGRDGIPSSWTVVEE